MQVVPQFIGYVIALAVAAATRHWTPADALPGIGFWIALAVSVAVYLDAGKLKKQGAKVAPWLWAILVFLILLIALPSYLLLRMTTWRKQIDSAKGLTPRPMTAAEGVFATLLSGLLLLGVGGTLAVMAWLWGLLEA